jgi:hypothetical protein
MDKEKETMLREELCKRLETVEYVISGQYDKDRNAEDREKDPFYGTMEYFEAHINDAELKLADALVGNTDMERFKGLENPADKCLLLASSFKCVKFAASQYDNDTMFSPKYYKDRPDEYFEILERVYYNEASCGNFNMQKIKQAYPDFKDVFTNALNRCLEHEHVKTQNEQEHNTIDIGGR